MSSCVRVAISGALDFGSCGFFSRGARCLRRAIGWPGWNAGASACSPEFVCESASEAPLSSAVNCPPNCRPPAASRGPNLGPLPRARPPLPPRLVEGAPSWFAASVCGAVGVPCSACPPLAPPRPLPLRPPLCDMTCDGTKAWTCPCPCPSACCSAGVLGFLRGRLHLLGPLEASLVPAIAGGAAVAVDMVRS
jgi:hypothetical protein